MRLQWLSQHGDMSALAQSYTVRKLASAGPTTILVDSMHEVAPPTSPPYLPPPGPPLPPPNPPPTPPDPPPTPPPTSPPYVPPLRPPPYLPPPTFGSLRSTDGSLRSTRGPAPAPPLNNMTPAVATDRLVCAPPFVCTALPLAPEITRLMRWPQAAFCVFRLVCAPPSVCTTFSVAP